MRQAVLPDRVLAGPKWSASTSRAGLLTACGVYPDKIGAVTREMDVMRPLSRRTGRPNLRHACPCNPPAAACREQNQCHPKATGARCLHPKLDVPDDTSHRGVRANELHVLDAPRACALLERAESACRAFYNVRFSAPRLSLGIYKLPIIRKEVRELFFVPLIPGGYQFL